MITYSIIPHCHTILGQITQGKITKGKVNTLVKLLSTPTLDYIEEKKIPRLRLHNKVIQDGYSQN